MIIAKKEKHMDIIYDKLNQIMDPDQQMWIISHSFYDTADMTRIFKRCKEILIWTLIASISHFILAVTNRQVILKDLSEPIFSRLRVLNVESNNIHTL